ncbi:hypothetical protein HOF56_04455 [Candidatus Peribacteria bacterium]|jgi:hypothetical protein|nr:hypothetical protein [Candidatus Peribacteria bacterium]MBT4021439.1 hypothetical protein [Candidatus Peribacteria bacterium]MBT4240455.1 hypothetical protein [Candidatus Peribacteria bacterium]MBT4474537.1 hypothetical protein [Candidatus Peribacteria bacterium]
MQRIFVYIFFIVFLTGNICGNAFALDENEIENRVNDVRNQVNADYIDAQNFTCGGQMRANDERVLAYYSRRENLDCKVVYSCDAVDSNRNCIGNGCVGIYSGDELQSTLAEDCTSGSCTESNPRSRCSLNDYYRKYECAGGQTAFCTGRSQRYNCIVEYPSGTSPISVDEPMGWLDVSPRVEKFPIPRLGSNHWTPVYDSNASTLNSDINSLAPRDSSLSQLDLDSGETSNHAGVIHPWLRANIPLLNHPTALQAISKFQNPPNIEIILPEGGASLSSEISNLFENMFDEIDRDDEELSMIRTIGNEPDALLMAAEHLRKIPLLEIKYEPVVIRVPSISDTALKQIIVEWETWLEVNRGAIDASLVSVIEGNIETMRSYKSLLETIREYRISFPKYMDALLSYTEDVNTFLREEWIDVNAERLEDWHDVYRSYFLDNQAGEGVLSDLHEIYEMGNRLSHCLGLSCRLNAFPIDANVNIEVFPRIASYGRYGTVRMWEDPLNRQDIRMNAWPPFNLIHMPLPDLTFDFSDIYLEKEVEVPVLKVEIHPMPIGRPPKIDANLANNIKPLPYLRPPAFDLTFPDLDLPDPNSELFVVPEPPQIVNSWRGALRRTKEGLIALDNICSETPDAFLVSESDMRRSEVDPAAIRAYSFLLGGSGSSRFDSPSRVWPEWPSGDFRDTGLIPPNMCPDCATVHNETEIDQHFEMEVRWGHLQDSMLKAIDEWNAQVSFWSVISRDEITREHTDYYRHSSMKK